MFWLGIINKYNISKYGLKSEHSRIKLVYRDVRDQLVGSCLTPGAIVLIALVRSSEGLDPGQVREQVQEASGGRAAGAVDGQPHLMVHKIMLVILER